MKQTFTRLAGMTHTYTDEFIGIEYSGEYQLHVQKGDSYSLLRGNRLLAISLFPREDWGHLKNSLFAAIPQPMPDNQNAPERITHRDSYTFGSLVGEGEWSKLVSQKGKLLINDAHLLLDDGNHTIYVRVNDQAEFENHLIDSFLAGISFPGQPAYEELVGKAEELLDYSSPFAVELKSFSALGPDRNLNPKKYNFQFTGDELTSHQRAALTRFCDQEDNMLSAVLNRVYQYYTREEYPILSRILLTSMLPKIDAPEDISHCIALLSIHLHESRPNQSVPIGLTFSASWTENDVGVRIVDDEVEAVGTAYTALEPQ
jgi:hypothetical protein